VLGVSGVPLGPLLALGAPGVSAEPPGSPPTLGVHSASAAPLAGCPQAATASTQASATPTTEPADDTRKRTPKGHMDLLASEVSFLGAQSRSERMDFIDDT
jgi:hypothetical protein